MKTMHKIVIVIAITVFVFAGLRSGMIHVCNHMYDECEKFYDFFVFTSIHLQTSHTWDTDVREETIKTSEIDYEFRLEDNVNFFVFFVTIPGLVITAIWYNDRK